ncbi:MAG TPA: CPBP family intramembrane glutamic endopeptidase [Candidatus Acidoferrales bacterium]|nr:CPBP family intramembrane glutamic endopeptidase [Candidatus Acidoferrales bacterium]
MAEDYSAADASPKPSPSHNIFVGPNGIRAGWRLAIFLALDLAFIYGIVHIPGIRSLLPSQQIFTAKGLLFSEGLLNLLPLLLAAGVMTLIEKRSFADYGMPLQEAFGKRFWQGVPLGFVMLSILLLLIGALHGFSIDGVAVGGTAAFSLAILYFIGFTLVGLFEEFSFRGYMQSTLGSGIGFWPAAIILSIVFGAVHLGNTGEAKIGAFMAGCFGLVAAFALWRTENIWLPVGMHASFDWGETYFYGTPDSGILAQGHFLKSSFRGPDWLTGGTVGPEGSVFVFFVLILWVIAIHFLFPAKPTAAGQAETDRSKAFAARPEF